MSEEQNSRLYNENNDYGERDYAPRKSGKKKKRKESGGHVGRCILQVLGTLLLVGLCTGAILCCFAAVYIKTVIIPEAGAVDLSQFAVGENISFPLFENFFAFSTKRSANSGQDG